MASNFTVLRTCGVIFYLILKVVAEQQSPLDPWIVSIKVSEKSCVLNKCKYLLNVLGGEFLGHYSWRLTPVRGIRGGSCDVISPTYELREINTDQWETQVEVIIPHAEGKMFFCLRHYEIKNEPFSGRWVHQGVNLYLEPRKDIVSQIRSAKQFHHPSDSESTIQNTVEETIPFFNLHHDTDVNYNARTAAPHKIKDIEVLIKDKYVPLEQLTDNVQTDNIISVNSSNNNNTSNLDNDKAADDVTPVNVKIKKKIDNGENEIDDKEDAFENWNEDAIFLARKKRSTYLDVVLLGNSNRSNNEHTDSLGKSKAHIYNNEKYLHELESNKSDGLLTKQEILQSKEQLQNAIERETNEGIPEDALVKIRKQRQVTITTPKPDQVNVTLEGLRVETSDKEPHTIEPGIPSVLVDTSITLRLFGEGITSRTMIALTTEELIQGEPCKFLVKGAEFMVKPDSVFLTKSALFDVTVPSAIHGSRLYVCAKNVSPGVDPFKDEAKYIHQGTEPFKVLATHTKLLPLWVTFVLITVCLMFSALFSGLNLGLMSLDRTELKIISNTGTEQEKKYAKAIMPVRDHGNYLLCSILLGNVAVNSTFTILLDELTSGLFAVIFSTLAIVMLGEITPQAICSRHGLMVGAKSIMITKAVMGLTAPLAYPVSKLLDYFLGEEIGSVYNRERLKELVKLTTDMNDLDRDEVNIISGALELRKKTVADVMTKLEDVFMLPINSVLDFETMSEIIKSGYSRIPVYEGERGDIVTVLFIKDLAFVDPDDNTPLRTLCQYYQNPCNFVFEDVTLDIMFKQFKDGHKGHMAFVHRINVEGEGDPFYETIGLVTLEDVIEEMIQSEIVDETDVFMDNRTKRRRNKPANKLQDFTAFAERHENQRIHISPQLTLATFQFLSTSVDAFRPDMVSETVLRRLLRQDVIQYIKVKGKSKKDTGTYVYQQGKPVDYFVLILEGRVEVTVGRENLVFEAGPFTYFGVQALAQNVGVAESPTPSAMGSLQNINMDAMLRHTFVPDYSVRAITDLYYLTVKQSLYLAAKRATLMEKGALSKGATHEQFDTEVDKLPANQTLIELQQVSGQHSSMPASMLANSWPNASGVKLLLRPLASSWENSRWSKLQDRSQSRWPEIPKPHTSHCSKRQEEMEPYDCVECKNNNFWTGINKSVLNKSIDDVNRQDTENMRKRKKATFHTDTSLLTFHPVSPTNETDRFINAEDITSKVDCNLAKHNIEEIFANNNVNLDNELEIKFVHSDNSHLQRDDNDLSCNKANCSELITNIFVSNSNEKTLHDTSCKDTTDTSTACDKEYEKFIIDYTNLWREERLILERNRADREEEMLKQLSKILRILEMKDQT